MEDQKTYKITLADGTIIDNLTLNGNNYISAELIDASIFEGNCSPIVINDGVTDEVHEHMELVQVTTVNGASWIVLRDISQKELKEAKSDADIEYLAMMCDVEL